MVAETDFSPFESAWTLISPGERDAWMMARHKPLNAFESVTCQNVR